MKEPFLSRKECTELLAAAPRPLPALPRGRGGRMPTAPAGPGKMNSTQGGGALPAHAGAAGCKNKTRDEKQSRMALSSCLKTEPDQLLCPVFQPPEHIHCREGSILKNPFPDCHSLRGSPPGSFFLLCCFCCCCL